MLPVTTIKNAITEPNNTIRNSTVERVTIVITNKNREQIIDVLKLERSTA